MNRPSYLVGDIIQVNQGSKDDSRKSVIQKDDLNHTHIDPKLLSDEFYAEKHTRTLPIQSFQVLYQCFHPGGLMTWNGRE